MFPGIADYAEFTSIGHVHVRVSIPPQLVLAKRFKCLGPHVQEVLVNGELAMLLPFKHSALILELSSLQKHSFTMAESFSDDY